MSTPDVCKGKAKPGHKCPKCGTRHQSVRQYVNRNKPIVAPVPDWLPDADGDEDDMSAKSYLGDPFPPQQYADRRVSEPLTAGHQAPSSSDHGVGQGRNPGLAAHHPNLRQGSTDVRLFANGESADPSFGGNIALSAAQRIARPFATQEPHDVSVSRLDTPMLPQVRAMPSGDPTSRLPMHTAQGSAGPPNGTHSVSNANRPPTAAMKASDRVEVMRQAMFGPRGGGR